LLHAPILVRKSQEESAYRLKSDRNCRPTSSFFVQLAGLVERHHSASLPSLLAGVRFSRFYLPRWRN